LEVSNGNRKMNGQTNNRGSESQSHRQEYFKDTALGLVSTKSFPAIVGTADMMLKSAGGDF
jgi:Carbon dioxide concentrating mechanism/carboxysome shell protein